MESAEDLEKRAKLCARKSFFGMFRTSTEEAHELYTQAGNRYKQEHKWKEAARCFVEAAKLGEKNKDYVFAASNFVESSTCLRKLNPMSNEFLEPLLKATQIYNNQGRFAQTGRILKSLAETFEENMDHENAMKYYKESADSYDLDEYSKVSCSQSLLKYADLAAIHTDTYDEAIKIYEAEGRKNLKNDLLKYGVKDLLFKAGLLRILNSDATDALIAFAKYCTWDEKFKESREARFLKAIIDAFEGNDTINFQDQLKEFDSFARLDEWKVKVLYKLKEKMEGGAEDGGEQNEVEHIDLT